MSQNLTQSHYLQVWWRFNQKWNCYCLDNIFLRLSLLGPQGRVTLMLIDQTGPKSNLSEILYLSSLSASLMRIRSKMKLLSVNVWSDPKSNMSKFLWLSIISTSLMKIKSKMKSLSSRQHFPKSMRPLKVGNSHANNWKWAKIKLVQDFMPVLVICKFDEESMKMKLLSFWQHFPHYMCMGD